MGILLILISGCTQELPQEAIQILNLTHNATSRSINLTIKNAGSLELPNGFIKCEVFDTNGELLVSKLFEMNYSLGINEITSIIFSIEIRLLAEANYTAVFTFQNNILETRNFLAQGFPVEDIDSIRLDIFIMSGCPYSQQYITSVLPQLIEYYEEIINWTPRYMGTLYANNTENEKIFVCIREEEGIQKWYDYVICFYEEISHEICINITGINNDSLTDCLENRAEELVLVDHDLANQYNICGSPTTLIENSTSILGAGFERIRQTIEVYLQE